MDNIIDIVCVIYLLPATLLLLYTTLQRVRAERSGRPFVGRIRAEDVVTCFVPGLNLFALLLLLLLLFLGLCEYIRKEIGGQSEQTEISENPNINNFQTSDIMEQNENNMQEAAGKGVLLTVDEQPPVGDNTTIMLHLVNEASVKGRTPTAYFSPGMPNTQVVNRLIAINCGIDHKDIEAGTLSDEDWKKLDALLPRLLGVPLYIDDTPEMSLSALEGKVRALARDHGIRLVVVDSVSSLEVKRLLNDALPRTEAITSALKRLAEDLGITIFAVEK